MSKRAPNFSDEDAHILVNLVEDFKDVIQSKNTDAFTCKQKDDGWKRLAILYNASVTTQRTPEQLRTKFESLKKAARKAAAKERSERIKTGGGDAEIANNTINERLGILLSLSCSGLDNHFDSNSINKNWSSYSSAVLKRREHPSLESELEAPMDSSPAHELNADETPPSKKKGQNLTGKDDVSANSRRRYGRLPANKRNVMSPIYKFSSLAEARTELARLQIKYLKEHHEEDMRMKKTENNLKLKILEADLRIKDLEMEQRELEILIRKKELATI